jgi:HTH-type transcriptional regulator, competence development regulator
MPQSGFSAALKKLRERRNLSGRELSLIAKIDHAYESRLESGEKENPSDETVDKLLRGLKPSDRDAQILRWLANHPDTNPDWVTYMLDETSGTIEEFTAGAAMVHRGNVPTPEKMLERVRKILSEE